MRMQDQAASGVNVTGTGEKIDAPLTQPRSGPVLYEVVNCMGVVSPRKFDSVQEAAAFAKYAFPDQSQDPDRTGAGWTVQQVGADYIHQRHHLGPVKVL